MALRWLAPAAMFGVLMSMDRAARAEDQIVEDAPAPSPAAPTPSTGDQAGDESGDESGTSPKPKALAFSNPAVELAFGIAWSAPVGVATGAGQQTINGQEFDTASQDLSDIYAGRIPFAFELGFRSDHIYLGAYINYALAFPKSTASPQCSMSSCSGHGVEIGGRLAYYLAPDHKFDPWASIGAAVESATVSVNSVDVTLSGFQAVVLAIGVDYRQRGSVYDVLFGPFLSVSAGEYTSLSASAGGASLSTDIQNQTWHGWISLGVRAAYDFFFTRKSNPTEDREHQKAPEPDAEPAPTPTTPMP